MWFVGGCVVHGAHIDDESVTVQDSLSPNSLSPNSLSPNSLSPNGASLNSLSPNGISGNGTPISIAVAGPPLTGAGVVGSSWTGNYSDGTTTTLRIDAAMQGSGANSDVWSYRWSIEVAGVWHPLCVDAAGAPGFADATAGSWNLAQGVPGGGSYHPETSQFTLACRGSAIAKCVELGYKPWDGLASEIQTCVRAMRADYCGDGTGFTVTGTLINIFDDLGLQRDTLPWIPEAAWGPGGALCVSKKKDTRFDRVAHRTPPCFPHSVKPEKSCGTEFREGAAIITELAPQ